MQGTSSMVYGCGLSAAAEKGSRAAIGPGHRRPSGRLDRGVYRYGAVLLLLTASTFVMVAPTGGWARVVNALLFSAAILTLPFRAHVGRPLLVVALCMFVVAMGCAVAAQFSGQLGRGLADQLLAGLVVLVAIAIVDELRRQLAVTVQSITAALCIYLVGRSGDRQLRVFVLQLHHAGYGRLRRLCSRPSPGLGPGSRGGPGRPALPRHRRRPCGRQPGQPDGERTQSQLRQGPLNGGHLQRTYL